ncbi:MAG: hypothetical protein AB7G28_20005 [Pirellulales bacterium]
MKRSRISIWTWFAGLIAAAVMSPMVAAKPPTATKQAAFPRELVEWTPLSGNPIFKGDGPGNWDAMIRERGWILRESDTYRLWYTGYDGTPTGIRQLGYATSPDGLRWTRSKDNPLSPGHYIEDMMVVYDGGTYYMFAEGPDESLSQMLTSPDGIRWTGAGVLEIHTTAGQRIERPFGTPTVWVENGSWNLFYERGDLGVWLATSSDPRSLKWNNVQDTPVLALGPGEYDSEQIAVDQVFKYGGQYYVLYHGSGRRDGDRPRIWNTNVARSSDLIHWEKYPGNPIVGDNKSSGIVVPTGAGYRLYTMHDRVDAFESSGR